MYLLFLTFISIIHYNFNTSFKSVIMDNSYFNLWYLAIIQIYLALRYAVKAVMGSVDNYNILKLAMVLFVPIIGYYFATKKEIPIS